MKNIAFFFLAITAFSVIANAALYKVSYLTAQSEVVTSVAAEATYAIQSYSIEGWVRPSQSMDFDFPPNQFRNKQGIIFGASTQQSGLSSSGPKDAYLLFYLNKWSFNPGFALGYDTTSAAGQLSSSVAFNDVFGRWFFLYGAYHAQLNKVYFATKSTFNNQWQDSWSDEIYKNQISDGFFELSVGSSDTAKSNQFNGYVYDPYLAFSPVATYYTSVSELESYVSTLTAPTYIGIVVKRDFTFIGEEVPLVPSVQIYGTYKGADEYAVSGQLQLPATLSKGQDSLVFRLSTNNPEKMGVTYTEGDRALAFYIEKGKTLCFATYSILPKVTNNKLTSCFPEAQLDQNWLYFYAGYSRSLGRVFTYVRVGDVNYSKSVPDIYQVDPNAFYLTVGKDVLTTKLEANARSLTLEFGPGAYREQLYDSLPPVLSKDSQPTVVIPETYKAPESFQSDSSSIKSLNAQIVDAKYISSLQQFAIHFWFRRDLTVPSAADLDSVRTTNQALAGVTEKEDYVANPGLAVLYRSHSSGKQPAYIFQTYNDKGDGVESHLSESVEFSENQDQGAWHWVYFGYDRSLKEAYYTVKFGDGTVVSKIIRPAAHPNIGSLKAILGATGITPPVPGEFYDFQFVYYKGCYTNSANGIAEYFSNHVTTLPPSRSPIAAQIQKLDLVNVADEEITPDVIQNEGTEIRNYSIQMWAVWDGLQDIPENGSTLAFASLADPSTLSDPSALGDIVFQIEVYPTEFVFSTYNYGYSASQDRTRVFESIPFDDYLFKDQWCFYYFGHSQNYRKAIATVYCDSGIIGTVEFPIIQHIVTQSVYFTVGQVPFSSNWSGQIYQPTFIVQHELIQDLEITEDRPPLKPQCPILFSQCGFKHKIISTCDDVREISLDNVRSVYIPSGLGVIFYKKIDYKGIYIEMIESVDCIELGLNQDPEVEWSTLLALYNHGKLFFSDSEGNKVTLNAAKRDLLGDKPSNKKHRKQEVLGEKAEVEEEEKSFLQKLMFWRD